MGWLDGKVALVSGAARGQGRSHAVRLAQEGADIIAFDICKDIPTAITEMGSEEQLAETADMVKALDRRVVTGNADVRNMAEVAAVVDAGVDTFGRLDVVVANAGIASFQPAHVMTEDVWDEVIDINLSGVWKTCRAAIPHMINAGNGGSIVITSSITGLKGFTWQAHYAAAKHGVVGLMRVLAMELAEHNIRVNTVHPTSVLTRMLDNDEIAKLFDPDKESPSLEDATPALRDLHLLPVPWVESRDISAAVAWLSSDEARYVTGITLPVDAGATQK
jgi:(+)-trans-carveol dehydrogenase